MDPRNDTDWVTIGMHINDKSLSSDWAMRTWAIPQNNYAFRYFRVVHTGKNSFDPKGQPDEWSDVFVSGRVLLSYFYTTGGFELYGYLFEVPSLTSSPVQNPPYQPPVSTIPPYQQQQQQPPPSPNSPQQQVVKKPPVKGTYFFSICSYLVDPDVFDWDHDMDGRGIITAIGKSKLKVIASSIVQGKVEDFVNADKVTLWYHLLFMYLLLGQEMSRILGTAWYGLLDVFNLIH